MLKHGTLLVEDLVQAHNFDTPDFQGQKYVLIHQAGENHGCASCRSIFAISDTNWGLLEDELVLYEKKGGSVPLESSKPSSTTTDSPNSADIHRFTTAVQDGTFYHKAKHKLRAVKPKVYEKKNWKLVFDGSCQGGVPFFFQYIALELKARMGHKDEKKSLAKVRY